MLVGKLGLDNGFIVQAVRGLRTYLSGDPVKETTAPGFIIRRDEFDQTLVGAALEAGAHLMLSTRAVGRIDSNAVLLKRNDGQELVVRAQVIVGADGPRSAVGRWVGSVNRNLLLGVQVTVPLTYALEHAEVYFERDICAGYGWLFPRGDTANVGLGCKPSRQGPGTPAGLLRRFVERLAAQGKVRNQPIRRTSGWIPAEPVRKAVHGNVLLAGDAAGHTHPITGAGIFGAVTCGEMAGKWAAQSVIEGNPDTLGSYDEEWMDLLADTLDRAHKRRLEMEAGWDDFPRTITKCWIAFREYYDRRTLPPPGGPIT
jgi:flavin-dependent dehydrogenase